MKGTGVCVIVRTETMRYGLERSVTDHFKSSRSPWMVEYERVGVVRSRILPSLQRQSFRRQEQLDVGISSFFFSIAVMIVVLRAFLVTVSSRYARFDSLSV